MLQEEYIYNSVIMTDKKFKKIFFQTTASFKSYN